MLPKRSLLSSSTSLLICIRLGMRSISASYRSIQEVAWIESCPWSGITSLVNRGRCQVNERILAFLLASMGAIVVSLPCFHAIRHRFASARIGLLTRRIADVRATSASSLLEGTGLIDQY